MRLKKIAALALSAAMALSVMAPAALAAAPDDSENCIVAVQEFFDKMTSSNYTYLYAALDWNEYWANENVYAAGSTASSAPEDSHGEHDLGAFDAVSRATANHGLHRGSFQQVATIYAQDGSLKVYDTDTGALLTDVNAGTIGDDQRVTLDCEEDGLVWMELRDADSYELTAIRIYGPEGLVSDLSSLNETYNYLGYLTTDANGRPLYYGTRSVPGSSYATGCDVLDETGNVVMQGLGSCYSYYDNSLNALPDHVFVARRGFYFGWMDTDGNWRYCQSIFSSVNADDELGY